MMNDSPTFDKIKVVIKKMKHGKYPGIDDLIPELFVYGGNKIVWIFYSLVVQTSNHGNVPSIWRDLFMVY